MLTNQNSWDGYWSQGSTENRFQLPEEPEFFKIFKYKLVRKEGKGKKRPRENDSNICRLC